MFCLKKESAIWGWFETPRGKPLVSSSLFSFLLQVSPAPARGWAEQNIRANAQKRLERGNRQAERRKRETKKQGRREEKNKPWTVESRSKHRRRRFRSPSFVDLEKNSSASSSCFSSLSPCCCSRKHAIAQLCAASSKKIIREGEKRRAKRVDKRLSTLRSRYLSFRPRAFIFFLSSLAHTYFHSAPPPPPPVSVVVTFPADSSTSDIETSPPPLMPRRRFRPPLRRPPPAPAPTPPTMPPLPPLPPFPAPAPPALLRTVDSASEGRMRHRPRETFVPFGGLTSS